VLGASRHVSPNPTMVVSYALLVRTAEGLEVPWGAGWVWRTTH